MLEVDGLVVAYGRTTAVRELTFDVEAGQIVSIIGPNGAGKSTTLSAISGTVRPAAGRIRFDGTPLGGLAPERIVRRGLALVPERRRIFATLTVKENLVLGASFRKDPATLRTDLDAQMARFPVLARLSDRPASRLSGGEQQQLAIARALMGRPRFLMLDEPSLGLAPHLVNLVFETLEELRSSGVTILLVEQFAQKALLASDATHVLRDGRLVGTSTAVAPLSASEIESKYFGSSRRRAGSV